LTLSIAAATANWSKSYESVTRFCDQSTRKYSRWYQGRSVVFSTMTLSCSPVCGL
jgi:hypothetical protein